jgi:hypothetical protein
MNKKRRRDGRCIQANLQKNADQNSDHLCPDELVFGSSLQAIGLSYLPVKKFGLSSAIFIAA